MNADPRVVEFLPKILTRGESDILAELIRGHFDMHGFGVWAVEVPEVAPFVGFVGLGIPAWEAPFTPCVEVAWRIAHADWGKGYATEGAEAALAFGFGKLGITEILSWTVPANRRSRRVMEKIGMTHDERGDFEHPRLPEGHALRRHVVYRLSKRNWASRVGFFETKDPYERAQQLAHFLDRDAFELARPLLSPRCVYDVRGERHVGSNAILASYAAATRYAHKTFDEVRYESEVLGENPTRTFSVRFTDVLTHGGRVHRHRSLQHWTFGDDLRIERIVHEDLPGEREAVRAFARSRGITMD